MFSRETNIFISLLKIFPQLFSFRIKMPDSLRKKEGKIYYWLIKVIYMQTVINIVAWFLDQRFFYKYRLCSHLFEFKRKCWQCYDKTISIQNKLKFVWFFNFVFHQNISIYSCNRINWFVIISVYNILYWSILFYILT